MSAYLVSKEQIDVLVQAGLEGRGYEQLRWHHGGSLHRLTGLNADIAGRMLWEENLASIAYLYPRDGSGNRPGPTGLTDDDIHNYEFAAPRRAYSAVEVLKLIHNYVYQSCEHPGWERSNAKAFCEALQGKLVRQLPGYDAAPWGI